MKAQVKHYNILYPFPNFVTLNLEVNPIPQMGNLLFYKNCIQLFSPNYMQGQLAC